MLKLVRGKGLLNAIVVEPMNGYEAWDVCLKLKEKGRSASPLTVISFACPPLVITEAQLMEAVTIIQAS